MTMEIKTKYCGIYKVNADGKWYVLLDDGSDYYFGDFEPTETEIESIRNEYVATNWPSRQIQSRLSEEKQMYRLWTKDRDCSYSIMSDWQSYTQCKKQIIGRWGFWPGFAFISKAKTTETFIRYNGKQHVQSRLSPMRQGVGVLKSALPMYHDR